MSIGGPVAVHQDLLAGALITIDVLDDMLERRLVQYTFL